MARLAAITLSSAVAVLCLYTIATNLRSRTVRNPNLLVFFLLPWIAVMATNWINGRNPAQQVILYPLIALAAWLLRPTVRVLSTAAWAVTLTATLSLALAAVRPSLAFYSNPGGSESVDKAVLFPQLLAGPYGHPNLLGAVLALGIPTLFVLRSRLLIFSAAAPILVALVWTSARTSMIAAGVTLALACLVRIRRPWTRLATYAALLTGVAVTTVTPLITTDPLAFSERGRIWLTALQYWKERPWVGYGTDYFRRVALIENDFGAYAYNGHNIMVDLLATAGAVGAVAVAVWLIMLLRATTANHYYWSAVPLLWLISFVYEGWLEARLSVENLAQLGFIIWIPAAVIALGATPPPQTTRFSQGRPKGLPTLDSLREGTPDMPHANVT